MDNLLVNLKAALSTTPQRWHQITRNFSDDLLRRQPLPGEWSALEVLVHLIDTEQFVFPSRVQSFLDGKDFEAFDPDAQGMKLTENMSATDLAQQFEAMRNESLKLVEALTVDDLSRTATHSELGLVTLGEMLHEWGGHDLMHLVQAEQALLQPFIAGCGAWESYFTAHIARASAS